ncbi:hypothetical protein [Acidithrix sp. C25]|uniref:hypothetical protein n=1 Tax=Acidithrix sp. C25 TaxID=1671482 RepID=UPI00191BA3CD|nr:hypothetical protein [Acidithrix sp. C25]
MTSGVTYRSYRASSLRSSEVANHIEEQIAVSRDQVAYAAPLRTLFLRRGAISSVDQSFQRSLVIRFASGA